MGDIARIAICTTWGAPPHVRYWKSIIGLQKPGPWVFFDICGKMGVGMGRNRLIEQFLDSNCEWALHVDADAVLHPGTLRRLLSWDKPLVSALAFTRGKFRNPVVYIGKIEDGTEEHFSVDRDGMKRWLLTHTELLTLNEPAMIEKRPHDALIRVDRAGAHCLLTHRRVFEAVEPPWFQPVGKYAAEGAGEDFYFHREAQKAGFTSYVDLSVVAGHLNGDWCVGALDFLAWSGLYEGKAFQKDDNEGRKRKRKRTRTTAGPVDILVLEDAQR